MEIAYSLKISKTTLYENFQSKESLFSAVIDDVLMNSKEKLEKLLHKARNDEELNIDDWLKELWHMHHETRRVFSKEFLKDMEILSPENWKKIKSFKEEQFQKNFDVIYDLGYRLGYINREISKEVLYLVYYTLLDHLLKPELASSLSMNVIEVLANISRIITCGILTDEGKEQIMNKLSKDNIENN